MSAPGGFIESCSSTAVRPRPTVALPERGGFDFPAPYNTRGIRVTNADDGPVLPTGYSYWCAINAHAGQDHLLVFLGTDRNHGGAGPSLWRVDKATDAVTPLGPLFSPEDPLSWQTGEGWFWSPTDPDVLYISTLTRLSRLNVRTRAIETVVDIAGTGKVLWQWHADHAGTTFSATLKHDQTYAIEAAIVYREALASSSPWSLYPPARGMMDECQVSKDGAWLLIKDNVDGADGEDNRIIRLADGHERVLMDRQGAAGHSDNGYGYMVASDNWNDKPNALRLWMFDGATEPQGRLVYHSSTWETELNHVSHGNARPGAPDAQFVIGSGATRNVGSRANEIVAVPLDGSLRVLVIAPTLTDLDAPGGGSDDYSKLPKGNVDVAGEYFLWTSNHGSDRLDAFLVRIPQHLLVPSPPNPETPPTHPPPTWRMEGWGPAPIVTRLPPA